MCAFFCYLFSLQDQSGGAYGEPRFRGNDNELITIINWHAIVARGICPAFCYYLLVKGAYNCDARILHR